MINLLPPDVKQSYQYARRNARLARWAFLLGLSLFGLVALSVGGLWYLQQQAKIYDSQIAAAEASLKQQDQSKVQKQITDISSSLKLAVSVLSQEVQYSELLKQLAVVIPNNASLTNLNISQQQDAVDITANTADYNAATQLQVNLSDPDNKIFSRADIVNINCAASTTSTSVSASKYPCVVTIRALFAADNPFLFINGGKQTGKPAAGGTGR